MTLEETWNKELSPMARMWKEEYEHASDRSEYANIPERTKDTIKSFVLYGRPGGSFLEAVLMNDLFRAMALADEENKEALEDIVKLVYNHCPSPCWGNNGQYEEWLAKGGLLG